MTPYLQKMLNHCVWMAEREKSYAWWAANNYAQMDPALEELPALLTAEMRSRNPKPDTDQPAPVASLEKLRRLRAGAR
jgi:hypothetical protein